MICNSFNTSGIHIYKAYMAATDRVDEGAIRHLHQGLTLGLSPVNGHGLGELELELVLGHGEERRQGLLLTRL